MARAQLESLAEAATGLTRVGAGRRVRGTTQKKACIWQAPEMTDLSARPSARSASLNIARDHAIATSTRTMVASR